MLLQNLKKKSIYYFIDPNETLTTLIAPNVDTLNSTNNKYKYLEINAKLMISFK